MADPIISNKSFSHPLIGNFKRTKNCPIDDSWLISSISNLDTEIPEAVRYPGLYFYSLNERSFYYFETDLELPIKDNNKLSRYIEVPLAGGIYDYTNLDTLLSLYMTKGQSVYISPLGLLLFYDGTNFKYGAGEYQITDQTEWDTIPSIFRFQYARVNFQGVLKIVSETGELTDEVIHLESLQETFENARYYEYEGNLYYFINSVLYNLTSDVVKLYQENLSLQVSADYTDPLVTDNTNIITHNLDSTKIFVQLIDYNNLVVNATFQVIDSNNILIKSLTTDNFTVVVYKL